MVQAFIIAAMALMPLQTDIPKLDKQSDKTGAKKPLEGRPPYEFVREQAIKHNKVLLVFVGCHPDLAMGTALKHYVQEFPGCTGPCIVVGTPHKGDLYRSDHKASATELDIMDSVMQMKAMLKARDEKK